MLTWSEDDIQETGRVVSAFLLDDGTEGAAFTPDELCRIAVPALLALRRRALLRGGTLPAAPDPGGPRGDGDLLTRMVRTARADGGPEAAALAQLLLGAQRLWTGGDGALTGAEGFTGPLAPVAAAALHPGPDPDAPRIPGGTPVLVAVARHALTAAGPRFRHRIAVAVSTWGLPDDELRAHLAPLDELRDWADGLVAGAGPEDAAVLGPLRDAVDAALERGDIDRAEDGAELLGAEHRRLEVTRRLHTADRSLAPAMARPDSPSTSEAPSPHGTRGGPSTGADGDADEHAGLLRLHLRTAEMYLAAGDLDTAVRYLEVVEQESASTVEQESASARSGPAQDPAPVPVPVTEAAPVPAPSAPDPAQDPAPVPDSVPRPTPGPPPEDPVEVAARLLDRGSPERGAALRATLTEPHRGRHWQALAEELREEGDQAGADAVFALGHPPLPTGTDPHPPLPTHADPHGPLPADSTPHPTTPAESTPHPTTPSDSTPYPTTPADGTPLPHDALTLVPLLEDPPGTGSGTATGTGPGPGSAPEGGTGEVEPLGAAAYFARAVAEGSPVALGRAVGWYVRGGDPDSGLALYARYAHTQYFGAAAVWNIACAYASAGRDGAALESLRVFARVLPGVVAPDQRAAVDAYCGRLGTPSPLPRVPAPAPAPAPGATASPGATAAAPGPAAAPVDEPALAARAKELHDGGRTDDAVRLLDELLRANPSAPAAYLLMRIHRERGDLAAARAATGRIEAARGELSWRHHVELARVALDRRCTDLGLAREQLGQARAKGAGPHWTQPLEERLERASAPQRTPAYGSGSFRTGDREPDDAQALFEGQLPELLAEARSGRPRPGRDLATVLAHLRSTRMSLPPPGTLNLVIKAVLEIRDDFAVRDLAAWLMDHRYWDEAVEVLQSCVQWISPERLPRILHLRDQAARAGSILEELNPACPPVREDVGSPVRGDRQEIQPHLVRIVEPEASLVAIWRAQNPPALATQNDLVDLWTDAVRAHPVALGNALGQLIISGRPEDALRLHSAYADEMWLTAGAAWNLGCAYAATGRLTAAADTFVYHARVTTRWFTAQQNRELAELFGAAGRAVPQPAHRPAPVVRGQAARTPAHRPPRAALYVTEAESTAARLVAQCRNAPSTHHFRLAADAVRKAIRLDRGGQERHVATVRELFPLQPPEPATAAALVMVLETARMTAEAWELLARWIDDTGAHPELLGPAVRIAREAGRLPELRDALLAHLRPDAGFEHYLTLAKASDELGDGDGRVTYAQQALTRNQSCAEAAYLLDPEGQRAEKAVQVVRPRVRLDAGTPRERAVALLEESYGTAVDFLDQHALIRYRPTPNRGSLTTALKAHKKARLAERDAPPELLADATDMIVAAEREDWEAAAAYARELVKERPWHAGIANAAAMCLIRLHDLPELSATEKEETDDEIRGLSDLAGTPQIRQEILVQLDYARARYERADALLTAAPHWWRTERDVWAQVGLRAGQGMCGRPAAAAALLLEYGKLRPGQPGMRAAAVAALLAHRGGDGRLTDEAIAHYRLAGERDRPAARLVTDALAADLPEILNSKGVPVLPPEQIDRVARHLADDPPRLLSFLRRTRQHGNRKGPDQRREVAARKLHQFRAYAGMGRVGAALARLREAGDSGASPAEVRAPLEELCARHGHPDPVTAARELLERPAAPSVGPPPGEAVRLAAEIAELPPDTELPERVARFMAFLMAGVDPLTGAVAERLAGCWDRQARLILATARLAPRGPGTDSVAELTARTAAALAESDPLAEDTLLRESAFGPPVLTVQRALRVHWQHTAQRRLQQGEPVLAEPRATRIGSGPVEAVFELRAGQQPPEVVRVGCEGAAYEWESGELTPEESRKGSLVIDSRAREVTLTLRWRFPGEGWSEPVGHPVPVEPLERRGSVRQRFTPRITTGKDMFVGRRLEKAEIRRAFEDAPHAPVSPQFITGARRAGKTSLIEHLRRLRNSPGDELPPPSGWPVPHLFPALVSGQSQEHPVRNLLPLVAADIEGLLSRVHPDADPSAALAELRRRSEPVEVASFAAWWDGVRRTMWPGDVVKPLVIIDECQDLLRGYKSDVEAKRRAFGMLRDLTQRGEIALLFSGSCTHAQLETLLGGTKLDTDIAQPLPIGLLDSDPALEVIHQGFPDDGGGTRVEVLNRSAIAAYEATLGHPYHLHLLGEALAKLLKDRDRRVIDPRLVREAVHSIATSEGAVTGLLDQYDAPEKIPPLLFEVADRLKDSRWESDVKAGWSDTKSGELADYIDLGLLRREGRDPASLAWVNPIVERWFDSGRHRAAEEQTPETVQLLREGLQVVSRDERDGVLVARVRDARGLKYRATWLQEGDAAAAVARYDRVAREAGLALPGAWRHCGRWFLQEDVGGRSFTRCLENEDVPPERAVRWIVDAAQVLDEVYRRHAVTHGDIHPDNLALVDGEVRLSGWGHSGTPDPARPGEVVPPPWDSVYYRPACDAGVPRTPQHDTVALAALLHQLLDPERRLPWPDEPGTAVAETNVLVAGPVGKILYTILKEPRAPRTTTPGELADELRRTLPADPVLLPAPPSGITVITNARADTRVERRTNDFRGPVGAVTGDHADVRVDEVSAPGPGEDTTP
ncbi:hypothetical protein ACIBCB_26230 [Streptomyces uncialis]|uniref:hypothetical protein n=1 Tax=Streptomyces uncialis TaxID=1048205 RepID=UPI0037A498C4